MHLYEIFVIYLALGAPLAMLRLTREYKGVPIRDIRVFALEFILWLPLAFVRRLRLPAGGNTVLAPAVTISDPESIATLRKMLENTSNGPGERILRSDLERYLCLYDAAKIESFSSREEFEILSIAGNRNEVIGSACLSRRNLRRLIEHRDRARIDLERTIGHLHDRDQKEDLAPVQGFAPLSSNPTRLAPTSAETRNARA